MVVPLPATTHITLPPVKAQGHYLELSQQRNDGDLSNTSKSHGYLHVSVDIGRLEQNLTTDLLNHLIFLQKGFIKVFHDLLNPLFSFYTPLKTSESFCFSGIVRGCKTGTLTRNGLICLVFRFTFWGTARS